MQSHRRNLGFTVAATAAVLFIGAASEAAPIYLNSSNITVSLGPTMASEPFENQTTAISLANVIDAPSADAGEDHLSPTTHVWVSGGPLELIFDFGTEYDLTTLHFWNYFSEDFDVDNVAFTFFNAAAVGVGTLDVTPALGGAGGNPIFAEDYALSFPSNVRFVHSLLTGTNGEVDFNNIGFTAELSNPTEVPEPATLTLFTLGLAGLARFRKSHRRKSSV
jgi:hypothetical protein